MDRMILIEIIGAIAVVILDLVAIALAVSRSHGSERTLRWVFAILALHGVGSVAYFLLTPNIRRRQAPVAAVVKHSLARRW
jgi:hypothetical protein